MHQLEVDASSPVCSQPSALSAPSDPLASSQSTVFPAFGHSAGRRGFFNVLNPFSSTTNADTIEYSEQRILGHVPCLLYVYSCTVDFSFVTVLTFLWYLEQDSKFVMSVKPLYSFNPSVNSYTPEKIFNVVIDMTRAACFCPAATRPLLRALEAHVRSLPHGSGPVHSKTALCTR